MSIMLRLGNSIIVMYTVEYVTVKKNIINFLVLTRKMYNIYFVEKLQKYV